MNWSTLEGSWKEISGQVKNRWGKLTDDDLTQAEGKKDRLLGAIQKRYGIAKEEAEHQISEFLAASESWLGKAKETVAHAYEKTKENVSNFAEKAKENVTQAVDKGRHYVTDTTASQKVADLRDLVGRYPIQATIVGLGLGFLIGRIFTSATSRS
jgi:uncharacterized protein YjbJ (UPF0337 family)